MIYYFGIYNLSINFLNYLKFPFLAKLYSEMIKNKINEQLGIYSLQQYLLNSR